MTQKITEEEYELIAKHCPKCESLILARVDKDNDGEIRYSNHRCSRCDWKSPICNN